MHPYNEPDRVEKTFVTVGMIATAVFVMALLYSFFCHDATNENVMD